MNSPPRQLDIFTDSHEVTLRNAVFDALQHRDAAHARAAWLALQADGPQDTYRARR